MFIWKYRSSDILIPIEILYCYTNHELKHENVFCFDDQYKVSVFEINEINTQI